MRYFKDDIVEVIGSGTGKGNRWRVSGTMNIDARYFRTVLTFCGTRDTMHPDFVFLYHRPWKNHVKAVMGALAALLPMGCGAPVRNAVNVRTNTAA